MRSRSQKLILSNPQLAALYNELTPITVSESDFWTRYYYHFIACYEREAVGGLEDRNDCCDGVLDHVQ